MLIRGQIVIRSVDVSEEKYPTVARDDRSYWANERALVVSHQFFAVKILDFVLATKRRKISMVNKSSFTPFSNCQSKELALQSTEQFREYSPLYTKV